MTCIVSGGALNSTHSLAFIFSVTANSATPNLSKVCSGDKCTNTSLVPAANARWLTWDHVTYPTRYKQALCWQYLAVHRPLSRSWQSVRSSNHQPINHASSLFLDLSGGTLYVYDISVLPGQFRRQLKTFPDRQTYVYAPSGRKTRALQVFRRKWTVFV